MKWWLLALMWPVIAQAQVNQAKVPVKWLIIPSGGISAGQTNTKLLGQVSGGVGYKHFFTGIGFGYDAYKFATLSVFLDWRMSFTKTKQAFVYANIGYNFALNQQAGYYNNGFLTNSFSGGFYYDAGLGYKVPVGSKNRLLFSAGFSQKKLVHRQSYKVFCLTPPCPDQVYSYAYMLGRIVAKIGWEFQLTK